MKCSVTNSEGVGCKNEARTGTICSTHRNRVLRHGDVQADRPIRPYTPPAEWPTASPLTGATEEERFWERVDRHGRHWRWTGSQTNTGYGQANLDGFNQTANRIAWKLQRGAIPPGARVVQECDGGKLCVRPDHLKLVLPKAVDA